MCIQRKAAADCTSVIIKKAKSEALTRASSWTKSEKGRLDSESQASAAPGGADAYEEGLVK